MQQPCNNAVMLTLFDSLTEILVIILCPLLKDDRISGISLVNLNVNLILSWSCN